MHFVLFVKLYPILSLYESAFWKYARPSSAWAVAQGSAWQLSWVAQLFYVIIGYILVIGICDGTYNMLVNRQANDPIWHTIGLPRLKHRHFIWVRPSTDRHCVVSLFSSSCHDGPPLSWKGIQQTAYGRSLDHKPRPSNVIVQESKHHFSCHLWHA